MIIPNGTDLSWVSNFMHFPLGPPASPVSCQDLALQALFHRAPQLVLTLELRVPSPQPSPAPWSPAVAKTIKTSPLPREEEEGGEARMGAAGGLHMSRDPPC